MMGRNLKDLWNVGERPSMQVTRVSVGGETDMEKEENWERDWESSRTSEWQSCSVAKLWGTKQGQYSEISPRTTQHSFWKWKQGEKLKSSQCWRSGYLLASKEQRYHQNNRSQKGMDDSSCWKKTTVTLKFCIYLNSSSEMNKKLKICKKIIMSTSVLKEILKSILRAAIILWCDRDHVVS